MDCESWRYNRLKDCEMFFFCLMFVLGFFIRSVFFFIVTRRRKEKKWSDKFYNKIEVFEDSHVDPSVFFSFLTNPHKIKDFDYKNKIKSIVFNNPMKVDSEIKIKPRKMYACKGVVSHLTPESNIVFEYHVWPNATRYIVELEIVKIENKTRYIFRMKAKNLLVPILIPLTNKIFRRINERISNGMLELLRNCLLVCENSLKEMDQKKD